MGDRTDATEVVDLIARGAILVHEAEGRIAGCVAVEVDPASRRGYLGLLSVDPAVQRTGAGRRLVEAAEAHARAAGALDMDLKIVDLRDDLPPFYRALGYEEGETSPFPPEAAHRLRRRCHFVHYAKRLG